MRRGWIGVLLLAAALLTGCGAQQAAMDADGLSGSVVLLGSTSMERVVGTLAERFRLDHPNVAAAVEGGGSSAGIEAVGSGFADIGLSSRYLKESEAGLTATLLALDGIAVIVHEDNPVTELTVAELAGLFDGELTSWAQVGGADLAVACVGRESGSGTRDGFESVTGTEKRCVLAQELVSNGAVIEAVRGNPQAIGYAALSSVEGQAGIRAVAVDGVACTEETVRAGDYPVSRPFLLVTRTDASLTPQAQAFYDFALSPEAEALIRAAGAVPAT